MMANQKSGTLAAVMDRNLANRSAAELGRYAARLPITTARTIASSIVVIGQLEGGGEGPQRLAAADSPVRSDVPKSRREPWR